MKRLTKEICGRAHGAEGASEDKLTGAYCRGEFEATAIVERLFAIEEILGDDYDLERLCVIVNQRMSMREEVQERFSITKNIPVGGYGILLAQKRKVGLLLNLPTLAKCVRIIHRTGTCLVDVKKVNCCSII